MQRRRDRLREAVKRQGSRLAVESFFRGLARIGRTWPTLRADRNGVERIADLPYRDTGLAAHTLDVYRPVDRTGPLPVVLYVHGGGFRILSKDTHGFMGVLWARRGYVVVHINYRLAPANPFPAALEDTCAALRWTLDNVATYGGDPDRIAFAGESAGGNLVTALAIATAWERPEPYARAVFDTGVTPRAVMPACGILQVSDPERFMRRKRIPAVVAERIREVSRSYLPQGPNGCDLADPLCVLENAGPPARPLPPFFAPVGTADPILDDTRRLARALDALGVPCDDRYYEGGLHAFHAFLWRSKARRCWDDMLDFTDRTLGAEGVRVAG